MDYQRFAAELPQQYKNWGQASVQPLSTQFLTALAQVGGMTSANILQLLNFAVACLEPGEVYCEVGCLYGSTLIGALLNHPTRMAYAIDNFSEFNPTGDNETRLLKNLSAFELEDQILVCNQDFEAFFADLRQLQPSDRIGVYFYDGAHDYRSQLMGLLLVRPFLAERALIVIDDSNWDTVQQATWDFIASHPQAQLLLELPTAARQFSEMAVSPFWNGLHILSWDQQQQHSLSWADLLSVRKSVVIQAMGEMPCHSVANVPTHLERSRQQGQNLQTEGRWAEAVPHYQTLLQQYPTQADLWYELAVSYHRTAAYGHALNALTEAIQLQPKAAYYDTQGLILQQSGQIMQAAQAYQHAIALDAQYAEAYTHLGDLVAEHGDINQAELIYQQAVQTDPQAARRYLNWGNVLLLQGKVDAAIQIYSDGLAHDPTDADLLSHLALAQELALDASKTHWFAGVNLYQRHRYPEAIAHLQALSGLATPAALEVYITLADCYEQLRQYETVIQTCQQGIADYPDSSQLHAQLIRALRETNQTAAAIAHATLAAQQFPDHTIFLLQQHLLLPLLYQSEAEIDTYRDRFTQGLTHLIQDAVGSGSLQSALNQHTNFLLAYQGKNDLDLQRQYGQFVHHVMATVYPQWVESLPPRSPAARKIRIGYVSPCFWEHTVGKLMIGWWRHCDRHRFELYTYSLSPKVDALTAEYRQHSHFRQLPEHLEPCQQILTADQLDVLVFIDLGQHPLMTSLAALRLAPVQCTTWAHPITSGLPTVDYFLSSDLMEPENASEHYSEQLIRLPNIGICFAKPDIPVLTKSRSDWQLREDAVIYLNSQMLCKCLPQQDSVLAAIAQQVPNSQFVFIARPNQAVAQQFQQRLQTAFAAVGLDSNHYCVMLPPLNPVEYWHLNQVCDVFLDSFGWSGGHTTLEAIACGLPIVTLPGEFMRGRHSAAILKMLGVTDTIAATATDYVQIASRLGQDPTWRTAIAEQMSDRHANLYNDVTCIAALETFYQQVVLF